MITEDWLLDSLKERGLTIEGVEAEEITARVKIENSWNDSLVDVIARLSKYVDEKNAHIDVELWEDHGDEGADLWVSFNRLETDNEIGRRINQAAGREERDRGLYEYLRERFEGGADN